MLRLLLTSFLFCFSLNLNALGLKQCSLMVFEGGKRVFMDKTNYQALELNRIAAPKFGVTASARDMAGPAANMIQMKIQENDYSSKAEFSAYNKSPSISLRKGDRRIIFSCENQETKNLL